jgi:cobalt-zinc-cadmium efflux system protein
VDCAINAQPEQCNGIAHRRFVPLLYQLQYNMAHQHSHQKGLNIAFWLNAGFTIIEFAGGILTNSTAILTDAVHDLGDSLAIGLGIWFEKISGKERSEHYSYGYKRFSLLSALILSVFLLGGSIVMLVNAGTKLFQAQEVDSEGMLWLSLLGIAANGLAFLKVKGGGNHHHHDHGPHDHHNQNSKAIMLHLLEDVLGWVAVLIGAIVIYFTHWYWIDPLLSILIAVFIISRAVPNLKHTLKIFLQSVPEHLNISFIKGEISKIEGVQGLHDIHAWTLDGNYNVMSMHVVTEGIRPKVREQIENILLANKVHHPTVQIELKGEECRFKTC